MHGALDLRMPMGNRMGTYTLIPGPVVVKNLPGRTVLADVADL